MENEKTIETARKLFGIRAIGWWTWRGGRLAHPLTIARRLVAWPFMTAARAVLCVTVAIGWGLDAAYDSWRASG